MTADTRQRSGELSEQARASVRRLSLGLAVVCVVFAAAVELLPGGGVGWRPLQVFALTLTGLLLLMRWLPVNWNLAALLLSCSTVLALLATEAVLRVFFAPRYSTIYRLNDDTLHELIPGSSKAFRHRAANGGHVIPVWVDSEGYRGEELVGADYRVVVFGDSCIAAEFSELDQTFAEQLEDDLRRRMGRDVEVVDAGVAAYGPDQALRRMERDLRGLEPDLAVLAIFADNDFGNLVRNKLYRLGKDGELVENAFEVAPGLRREFLAARSGPMTLRFLDKSVRPTVLRGLRRLLGRSQPESRTTPEREEQRVEEWLQACRDEYRSHAADEDPQVTRLLGDHYDADISLDPEGESSRYKAALMDRIVARVQAVASERGVPLLLLIIPSPIDVWEDYDSGRIDPERYPEWEPTRLTNLLEQTAQRLAAELVAGEIESLEAGR